MRPWSTKAQKRVEEIVKEGRTPTQEETEEICRSENKSKRAFANLLYSTEMLYSRKK